MEKFIHTGENTEPNGDGGRDEAAQSAHCDYLMPSSVCERMNLAVSEHDVRLSRKMSCQKADGQASFRESAVVDA